jgi:hypothetical protein
MYHVMNHSLHVKITEIMFLICICLISCGILYSFLYDYQFFESFYCCKVCCIVHYLETLLLKQGKIIQRFPGGFLP